MSRDAWRVVAAASFTVLGGCTGLWISFAVYTYVGSLP